MTDLYSTLGVPRSADKAAIRRAYRKKAKSAHPDTGGSVEKFGALQRAHDILTDPDRRAKYDSNGDESDAPVDQSMAKAMQNIAAAFDEVLANVENGGRKPTEANLVGMLTDLLKSKKSPIVKSISVIAEAIRLNEMMLGRFSVKSGNNVMEPLIRARVDQLKMAKESNEKIVASIDLSIEVVGRHRYRWDEPSQPVRDEYSGFSPLVARLMRDGGATVFR